MMKIDLITLTGFTASDGSMIMSGATLKFDSEFFAASTKIKITPKLYRNRELFDKGYEPILVPEDLFATDFLMEIPEEEYYVLSPMELYNKVGEYYNNLFGANVFSVKIISE